MQGAVKPGQLAVRRCNPDLVGQVVQKGFKVIGMAKSQLQLGLVEGD